MIDASDPGIVRSIVGVCCSVLVCAGEETGRT